MSFGVLRRQSLTQVSEYPHGVVYGVAVVHACVKGLPATLFLSALREACNDLQTFLMVLSRRKIPQSRSPPWCVTPEYDAPALPTQEDNSVQLQTKVPPKGTMYDSNLYFGCL